MYCWREKNNNKKKTFESELNTEQQLENRLQNGHEIASKSNSLPQSSDRPGDNNDGNCDAHYDNMPMQYTEMFLAVKIENFQLKNFDIFSYFRSKPRLWVLVRTASPRRF